MHPGEGHVDMRGRELGDASIERNQDPFQQSAKPQKLAENGFCPEPNHLQQHDLGLGASGFRQ